MTIKRTYPKGSAARVGPLQGDEAVELYAAEIAWDFVALSEQADLLPAEMGKANNCSATLTAGMEGMDKPNVGCRSEFLSVHIFICA